MFNEVAATISQIEESKRIWVMVSTSLPTPENLQGMGVSVKDITTAFDESILLLNSLNESTVIDNVAWQIHKAGVVNVGNAILTFLQQNQTNAANILQNIQSICSWLWSLKNSVLYVLPVQDVTEGTTKQELSKRLRILNEHARQAEQFANSIKVKDAQADGIQKQLEYLKNKSTKAQDELLIIKALIEGYERDTSTAKTNSEASAIKAIAEADKVQQLMVELTEKTKQIDTALAENHNRQKELFDFFESKKKEVSGLLENANKVGLAKAFQDKRRSLQKAEWFWVICFAVGIGALFYTGRSIVIGISADTNWVSLILKIVVSGPLIWFTWFAVRQYGHALKMTEDYAYKEAAAMAYAGYRNEVAADPEMLKLLQKSAINAYGENPVNILIGDNEPSSPLHQAIDKAVETVGPDRLLDFIKEIVKREK